MPRGRWRGLATHMWYHDTEDNLEHLVWIVNQQVVSALANLVLGKPIYLLTTSAKAPPRRQTTTGGQYRVFTDGPFAKPDCEGPGARLPHH